MTKSIIGLRIVGYRYGLAPEGGRSWNFRERKFEPGVSMAAVLFDKEISSFAVSDAENRKKYYYVGIICGTGGDDEICLENVERITYKDFLKMRKNMIEENNAIVNDRCDRKITLINRGFSIGYTVEQIETDRQKHLRKSK